uniref:Uncharacterized protein n=1 Tax=Rhizophora mucronata TaxID=61149 RepID=A0A2P2QDU1_RHIMU
MSSPMNLNVGESMATAYINSTTMVINHSCKES